MEDDANNLTRASGEFCPLVRDVNLWGTPRAADAKDSGDPDSHSHSHMLAKGYLCAQVKKAKQQLNPDWDEALMGWEIGWTNPEARCSGVWHGWPMPQGFAQHEWEPERTLPRGTISDRAARIRMCGNGVSPQQAEAAFTLLLSRILEAAF